MKRYGMFSDAGDAVIFGIVQNAKSQKWTWAQTLNALRQVSEINGFGEAMDTAVREVVYSEIGAEDRDENFYV